LCTCGLDVSVTRTQCEKVRPTHARDELLPPSQQAPPASVICQSYRRDELVPSPQSGQVPTLVGPARLRLTHSDDRLRPRRVPLSISRVGSDLRSSQSVLAITSGPRQSNQLLWTIATTDWGLRQEIIPSECNAFRHNDRSIRLFFGRDLTC
jgi:hypothetical protein